MSKNVCKGRIYKANVYMGPTAGGFASIIRFVELKKKSCHGCKYCGPIDSDLQEVNWKDWPIIDIEKAEHGKLYTLEVCNVGYEIESGVIDEWDLKLVEYKGDKNEQE